MKLDDDSSDPSISHSPMFFLSENAISEGHLLVAHAREAGSIISLFPVSPRFLVEKMRVLKLNADARDPSVSNFHTFPRGKLQKSKSVSAADAYKTIVKVRILIDFQACLREIGGCMFAAGAPCRAP